MFQSVMCNVRRYDIFRELYDAPGSMEANEYELTWDVFRRAV